MANNISSDLENTEKQIEKRAQARSRRKARKMSVSGKSVFGLQRIIRRKSPKT